MSTRKPIATVEGIAYMKTKLDQSRKDSKVDQSARDKSKKKKGVVTEDQRNAEDNSIVTFKKKIRDLQRKMHAGLEVVSKEGAVQADVDFDAALAKANANRMGQTDTLEEEYGDFVEHRVDARGKTIWKHIEDRMKEDTRTADERLQEGKKSQMKRHIARLAASGSKWGAYMWGLGPCTEEQESGIEMIPSLIQPLAGVALKSVSLGDWHAAAVTQDGVVFTWGANQYGQLGHGAFGSRNDRPQMVQFFRAKNNGARDIVIKEVVCGANNTVALSEEGRVYCWGQGMFGQNGYGGHGDFHTPMEVLELRSEVVTKIYAVKNTVFALTSYGFVYSWGSGENAMHGHESLQDIVHPMVIQELKTQTVVQLIIHPHRILAVGVAGNKAAGIDANGNSMAAADDLNFWTEYDESANDPSRRRSRLGSMGSQFDSDDTQSVFTDVTQDSGDDHGGGDTGAPREKKKKSNKHKPRLTARQRMEHKLRKQEEAEKRKVKMQMDKVRTRTLQENMVALSAALSKLVEILRSGSFMYQNAEYAKHLEKALSSKRHERYLLGMPSKEIKDDIDEKKRYDEVLKRSNETFTQALMYTEQFVTGPWSYSDLPELVAMARQIGELIAWVAHLHLTMNEYRTQLMQQTLDRMEQSGNNKALAKIQLQKPDVVSKASSLFCWGGRR